MASWLETMGVIVVAWVGIALGRRSQRIGAPFWAVGYLFSLGLIVIIAFGRSDQTLQFTPPFSWIVSGRLRLMALALAISLGASTVLPRLPKVWEKAVVSLVMVSFVLWSAVLPALAPVLLRNQLAHLETTLDADGVCLQTTKYTCGPAAAVTALKRLGLPAAEGELAILSHASPMTGTLPARLCQALRDRYAQEGLTCDYRPFESVSQLAGPGITLAVIREAFLLDHCVAVLGVSDEIVTIADPGIGIRMISRTRFEAMWRFRGILLQRDASATPHQT